MTPHEITIEHPALAEGAALPAMDLAKAHSPEGDLTLYLPEALDDIGLVGGALGLAAVRGRLVSRVRFLSPRELSAAELEALREYVAAQLLDGIGEAGLEVADTHVAVGLVGGRPGSAKQKPVKVGPNPRPKLVGAVEKGDLAAAQRALVMGEDPDSMDRWSQTVLAIASRDNKLPIVQALLRASADPDGQWERASNTPLTQAATTGALEVVRTLLEAGAGVNVRPKKRNAVSPDLTPLGWAANRGHLAVARLLLDAGADPNARDERGRTPLHMLRPSALELGELLVARGADLRLSDDEGRDAIAEALHQAEAFEDPRWGDPEAAAAHRAKGAQLEALSEA